MAGKLAPRLQSGHVNAGASVRYQLAKPAGPPPGLPRARLGGQGVVLPRRLVGRGDIADAGTHGLVVPG
jgi:hypothetical protein